MISRRKMILTSLVAFIAAGLNVKAQTPTNPILKTKSGLPLPIGLNAGTILRFNLSLEQQILMASKYKYDAIEIWTRHIDEHQKKGGKLSEIKSMLSDTSLNPCNIIGFAKCMVDDQTQRAAEIEIMKRDMDKAAQLGSKNIAVTMLGIKSLDIAKIPEYAERYDVILNLGKSFGVTALLELWGHRALHNLADALAIAISSKNPSANLLLDFYHLYRGGNSFDSLNLINLANLPVFHINDYPLNPPREMLTDADRVLPGDGICPFNEVLPQMYTNGFRGVLSLEVFSNKSWSKYSAERMFEEGYNKTAGVIKKSLKS